jgi:polar amino acid transport system permease protein
VVDWLRAFADTAPLFAHGLWVTVQLALWSIAAACAIGLVLCGMRTSALRPLRVLASAYIYLIRGTPLVAQLFVIYFGLAAIVRIEAFWAAAIGLAVHNAAYVAEIFRAGLQSVPHGQVEAGYSLGMSRVLTLRVVTAPQALRNVLPALGNQFIIAVKDTSIAAFITVAELFQVAQITAAERFKPLEFYLMVSVYYLVVVGLLTLLVRWAERRLSIGAP